MTKKEQDKIGRNALCPCGSGNKYKRCCLASAHVFSPTLAKESAERLENRVKAQMSSDCRLLKCDVDLKMSEVILDLAAFLLKVANTEKRIQAAIGVTCAAWNIAVLGPQAGQPFFDVLLNKKDDFVHQEGMANIISLIVEQKQLYYPDINRIILDYELAGQNKDKFHLTIMSTVHEESISELKLLDLLITA